MNSTVTHVLCNLAFAIVRAFRKVLIPGTVVTVFR